MLATVSRFTPIHIADFGDFWSKSPILAIQAIQPMKSLITISDSKKIGVHESDRRIGDSRDFNAILVTMVLKNKNVVYMDLIIESSHFLYDLKRNHIEAFVVFLRCHCYEIFSILKTKSKCVT